MTKSQIKTREALIALRAGDVERFTPEYQVHGRLVAAPTAGRRVRRWSRTGGRRGTVAPTR
jgi:hypothetical protein